MCKFSALAFHANRVSAFVFLSSRHEGNDIVVESFTLIQDNDEVMAKSARAICYTPSALDCIEVEDNVKYCMKRELERSQIDVECLVYDNYSDDASPWGVLPRFRPFIERLHLRKTNAVLLARNLVDVEQLSFVCQTKCTDLQEFVVAVRTIAKGIRVSGIGNDS